MDAHAATGTIGRYLVAHAGPAMLQSWLVHGVAGVALGVAAGALMRVGHDADGALVTHASAGYAVLWLAVIGGRVAFAQAATGWAARSVGEFSLTHQITGAAAWTAAFVLMALAMVLTRVVVTALRARALGGGRPVAVS